MEGKEEICCLLCLLLTHHHVSAIMFTSFSILHEKIGMQALVEKEMNRTEIHSLFSFKFPSWAFTTKVFSLIFFPFIAGISCFSLLLNKEDWRTNERQNAVENCSRIRLSLQKPAWCFVFGWNVRREKMDL